MSISRDEVEAVARLAHLELSEDEAARMAATLGTILDYMAVLAGAEGPAGAEDGAGPAAAPSSEDPTPLRDDAPRPGLSPEAALAQAPETTGSLFKVPPMLAGGERP